MLGLLPRENVLGNNTERWAAVQGLDHALPDTMWSERQFSVSYIRYNRRISVHDGLVSDDWRRRMRQGLGCCGAARVNHLVLYGEAVELRSAMHRNA